MKKVTLFAAAAIAAVAAQAQDFNVNPSTSEVTKGGVAQVDYIILSNDAIAELTAAGATVNSIGPDDVDRFLYYWDNTVVNTAAPIGVDYAESEPLSLEVANPDWFGLGYCSVKESAGMNISHFNDNTIFHLAYKTPTNNGPESIVLTILDGESDCGSKPAKVSLGTALDGNPSVGAKINDEWQGIELSLSDLKKLYPTFDLQSKNARKGNYLAISGGAAIGRTMAFDAVYFYNREAAGIDAVEAESVDFVVTANTVSVMGANGIELYNIAGQLVKATEGTTLGIDNLTNGVYVVKAANATHKIVVK